jgi:hypothetical protein
MAGGNHCLIGSAIPPLRSNCQSRRCRSSGASANAVTEAHGSRRTANPARSKVSWRDIITSEDSSVEISFGALRHEGGLRDPYFDPLLRVVAELEIIASGTVVYAEPDFPVVELAQQLQLWLSRPDPPGDFEFTTVEAEETPFIWFKSGPDGWSLGAAFQQYADGGGHTLAQVRTAALNFVQAVKARVMVELRLDVATVIDFARRD